MLLILNSEAAQSSALSLKPEPPPVGPARAQVRGGGGGSLVTSAVARRRPRLLPNAPPIYAHTDY